MNVGLYTFKWGDEPTASVSGCYAETDEVLCGWSWAWDADFCCLFTEESRLVDEVLLFFSSKVFFVLISFLYSDSNRFFSSSYAYGC